MGEDRRRRRQPAPNDSRQTGPDREVLRETDVRPLVRRRQQILRRGSDTAQAAEADRDLRTVTTSGSYLDGEWHHISVTAVADGELTLYVDGSKQTTEPIDRPLYTGSGATWIGQSPSQVRPLGGAVDDVRIYDRAFLDSEVTALRDTASMPRQN
ncbi:LamG domain-containing protein [Haloquadratum walsbyi]|uniref:Laminin G domain protein n=1 Tax=Haloquadratum walsbyi J07HQW2 TaxID=1238425 RepID=U1PSF9_9EURY|nr:LamG domain-containing protein [Haloquadratum walsbyi]ERG96737.1 MAG: hypothetical protein J07HQW2_03220 [Haloquadratum walsbyi J07HQW2]